MAFSSVTGRPRSLARLVLYGTAIPPAQPKLFPLSALGEVGWLKALRQRDYAPRRSRPGSLKLSLFPYYGAWG